MRYGLVGRKVGLLTVLSIDGKFAICKCKCGNDLRVWKANLYCSNTRSCGCIKRTAQGLSNISPEYNSWHGIIKRCYNERSKDFKNYGGRGIYVCEEWRESFAQFLQDMGQRPTAKHSIERINNDGPYSPTNCKWATYLEQAANTRKVHTLTVGDKSTHVSAWSRKLGIGQSTIHARLSRGKNAEEALKTPRKMLLTVSGETKTLLEWSAITGIKYATLYARINLYGYSPEETVSP